MLKRLGLLLTLMGLLVISGVSAARSPQELTALASYYGEDNVIFASIRTDPGFFETLDGVLSRVQRFFPDDVPPVSVTDLLDTAAMQLSGEDFASGVGTWLGETAAVGMVLTPEVAERMNNNESPPLLIGLEISDAGAAETFIEAQLPRNADNEVTGYTVNRESGFVVYTPDDPNNPFIALGSDALFVATYPDILPLTAPASSLSASGDFNTLISALPEPDYNAVFYLNTPALNETVLAANEDMGMPTTPLTQQLTDLSGSQAWGFTILQGDTLTVDLAARFSNPDAVSELGIELPVVPPIDPAFTARIPADSVLVIQSPDFGPTTQTSLDQIRTLSRFIDENGGLLALIGIPSEFLAPEEAFAMESFSLNGVLALVNTSFSGLTGLSLERDVLPVLDGDVASYVRVLPGTRPELPVTPDFGLIFQTSNEAGAEALVDSLISASNAYGSGFMVEAYGEGAALVIPALRDLSGIDDPALDLLFAAPGDIFAFGTRPAVEYTRGDGPGLDSTATYQAASTVFLPNPTNLLYIDVAPLGTLLEDLIDNGTLPLSQEIVQVRAALSLLESATITSTMTDDPTLAVSRMTLTLGETPVILGPGT